MLRILKMFDVLGRHYQLKKYSIEVCKYQKNNSSLKRNVTYKHENMLQGKQRV